MKHILIVEDEIRIITPLARGLRTHGFVTTIAQDGSTALTEARSTNFDLIVLDIGLPDIDGWAVLKELRESGAQMPIVILTARDDIRDKVAGLEGGANDYVTKPFSFQELLARIRLRLRESNALQTKEEPILTVGNISLNLHSHQVSVGDQALELAAREFSLLEMLMQQPGIPVSREQLLKEVWGYDYDPGTNVVDVYIGYLRKKLGIQAIETVRGIGYRLLKGEKSHRN
jgi:DNA-binding response OmpR family regulator